MELIVLLIVVPCIAAILLLCFNADMYRNSVSVVFAILIGALSIVFAATFLGAETRFISLPSTYGDIIFFVNNVLDVAVALFILCYAIKYKRILALVLVVIQFCLSAYIFFTIELSHDFELQFAIDNLGVLMVLIIGIVGSGICVYALGYMKDFQKHQEDGAKDRRPWFFACMFAFLSAMFNIVLVDNLSWLYTAWEVTTLCSFLLIGFTKTEEAINNAFRQIVMNMLGGIAFQIVIIYLGINGLPLLLSEFIALGAEGVTMMAVPIVLLAFAAITKAAQMPFHTWLLGAMVAPTPTSALLHSSTMVKAGVFLLLKLSPAFLMFTYASIMVVLVGGVTFLFCSFMAISQSNAKRVLAYSTIANLGLITACAGVGTPEAMWAGMLLILFHAVSKSLLFLCVGTAEHHIGSRNIEDMDLLFERMPKLARLMMLGIMGMFIAPFGMLIGKWATLVSFADTNQIALIVILAFGSAATFFFWAKWLGKLSGIAGSPGNVERSVQTTEWSALYIMAVLVALCCICLPLISVCLVVPYLESAYSVYGALTGMVAAEIGQSVSLENLIIAAICALAVIVILFVGLGAKKSNQRQVDVYLAGVSSNNSLRTYHNSLSKPSQATSRNWYLEPIFGEKMLCPTGEILTTFIIAAGIIACCVMTIV